MARKLPLVNRSILDLEHVLFTLWYKFCQNFKSIDQPGVIFWQFFKFQKTSFPEFENLPENYPSKNEWLEIWTMFF